MKIEKFKSEIETVKKFFELYCKNKHKNLVNNNIKLHYKGEEINSSLNLCEDCLKTITYCFDRLVECPHEVKPRCRKCLKPCYGKDEWKAMKKVMKYSGIRVGLSSIKNIFKGDS
ncbi:MAG: hypothetical protein CR982_09865 [Candidatus Cloacimonadota bacterium]|nr:MAG: hypothetical protein CR982_09865 [Candidatus Cloacimonadota bacterium]PIE78212.1 MAG: hypothetical protein CSA15_09180 [Candidatus Delongbacteria bacterium]